jgi:DNA-binding CsgD family transcriptional regulator
MAERLRQRDIRTLLGFLRDLYASRDPDAFGAEAARCLFRVVPADRCSYSQWRPGHGPARSFVQPGGVDLDGTLGSAYKLYGHESPLLAYYRRVRRIEVRTFSDLMTRAHYHRSRLYNEYYRHVGVEYQIVVPLTLMASPTTGEVAFAMSRRGLDFSPRDRLMLELLQPHLTQAHATAEALAGLERREALLREAVSATDREVVALGLGGAPAALTEGAARRLAAYFGPAGAGRDAGQLPDALARWVASQDRALTGEGGVPPPLRPLVVDRSGRRLTVRLLTGGERRLLVLEERALDVEPTALASLGLTQREAEVLAWVAKGKANEDVASILGMRPATVAKHLEHVYRKLGVTSRTAAAAQALSASGSAG